MQFKHTELDLPKLCLRPGVYQFLVNFHLITYRLNQTLFKMSGHGRRRFASERDLQRVLAAAVRLRALPEHISFAEPIC